MFVTTAVAAARTTLKPEMANSNIAPARGRPDGLSSTMLHAPERTRWRVTSQWTLELRSGPSSDPTCSESHARRTLVSVTGAPVHALLGSGRLVPTPRR